MVSARSLAFLAAAASSACGGVSDETLLTGLTVVAASLEPGPPLPGVPFGLRATVSDPAGGATVAAWLCGTEACSLDDAVLGDTDTVDFTLTAEEPGVAWVVACVAGGCEPGAFPEKVLRDPISWMADQPFDDAFLGNVFVPPPLPDAPVPWNPVIEVAPDPEVVLEVAPGAARTLAFTVPGATTAVGRATAGGFGMASYEVASDGTVELEWFAPDPAGPARLYVVFAVEGAGNTVWSTDGSSLAP